MRKRATYFEIKRFTNMESRIMIGGFRLFLRLRKTCVDDGPLGEKRMRLVMEKKVSSPMFMTGLEGVYLGK